MFSRHVSIITFFRSAHSEKFGKPKKYKAMGTWNPPKWGLHRTGKEHGIEKRYAQKSQTVKNIFP
jgi:hypothetical protein